jgi:hypothetical protein
MRPFPHPRWDGSSLEGKTILLWCEHGVGDGMQFVCYAPLVKARGGTVFLECPPGLTRLMATCPGVDQALPGGEGLPPFDVQIPLLSLPAVFGTTPDSVPADIPYLFAEPQRVEYWKERLAQVNGFRVGVVWQGNPRFGWDHFRSFPLAALKPLAAVDGVRLISLQKGPGTEQLRSLKGKLDVVDPGRNWMPTAPSWTPRRSCSTSTWRSAPTRRRRTWRGRWACPCGWRSRRCPTGGGWWAATTRRGTQRCGCSIRVACTTGPPSFAAWPTTCGRPGRLAGRRLPAAQKRAQLSQSCVPKQSLGTRKKLADSMLPP